MAANFARQNSSIAFDEAEPSVKAVWVEGFEGDTSQKRQDLSPRPLGEGSGVRVFSALVCIRKIRHMDPEVRERKALTPTPLPEGEGLDPLKPPEKQPYCDHCALPHTALHRRV